MKCCRSKIRVILPYFLFKHQNTHVGITIDTDQGVVYKLKIKKSHSKNERDLPKESQRKYQTYIILPIVPICIDKRKRTLLCLFRAKSEKKSKKKEKNCPQ